MFVLSQDGCMLEELVSARYKKSEEKEDKENYEGDDRYVWTIFINKIPFANYSNKEYCREIFSRLVKSLPESKRSSVFYLKTGLLLER